MKVVLFLIIYFLSLVIGLSVPLYFLPASFLFPFWAFILLSYFLNKIEIAVFGPVAGAVSAVFLGNVFYPVVILISAASFYFLKTTRFVDSKIEFVFHIFLPLAVFGAVRLFSDRGPQPDRELLSNIFLSVLVLAAIVLYYLWKGGERSYTI